MNLAAARNADAAAALKGAVNVRALVAMSSQSSQSSQQSSQSDGFRLVMDEGWNG